MLLIGYLLTAAVYISFILVIAFVLLDRKGIRKLLGESIDWRSVAALLLILAFFIIFSVRFVSPTEQLYFDENIYQGIALNILNHGSSLWCQFGSGYVGNCYASQVYHDPVGWSAFIAMAFAVFGIGTSTAYNLELFAGALSIILVFILASVLTKRKAYGVVAAFAFAMMPQLFIWARTQADADLPFMMFATLAFLLFVIFTRRKSVNSFAAFAFSLDLVLYMRIEASLLVGVFAILMLTFGERGIRETFKERVRIISKALLDNTRALLVLLAFILLMLPQFYYIAIEAQNPSYGQTGNQTVISLANLKYNMGINIPFIFGSTNILSLYPANFHYLITPLAILGALVLIFDKRIKNRFGMLLLLLLWFSAYFMFYGVFFAGYATYGVDVRFMLQLLPALCLLAAFAILGMGDAAGWVAAWFASKKRDSSIVRLVFASVVVIASAGLLFYPFFTLVPLVALSPSMMPQQSVILPAINYFYANYNDVPQNCFVFSFTPEIWWVVNRSASEIGYMGNTNQTLSAIVSQHSCLVFDYGYWCVVPPFHSTACAYTLKRYKLQNLTSNPPEPGGNNVTFYRILNYS